jgi:hypothetical protein
MVIWHYSSHHAIQEVSLDVIRKYVTWCSPLRIPFRICRRFENDSEIGISSYQDMTPGNYINLLAPAKFMLKIYTPFIAV